MRWLETGFTRQQLLVFHSLVSWQGLGVKIRLGVGDIAWAHVGVRNQSGLLVVVGCQFALGQVCWVPERAWVPGRHHRLDRKSRR